MGRYSTGAISTSESTRIELSYLIKNKFLVMGSKKSMTLDWTNGHQISAISNISEGEKSLRLIYTITNQESKKVDFDYKVQLCSVPSNLGKGEVLYFICPISGIKCRVLYMAYGSEYFKARSAYQNRIYYPSQLSSKLNKPNDRYWELSRRLEKFEYKHHRKKYNGNPTKKEIKLQKMYSEIDYLDQLRWSIDYLPYALRQSFDFHQGDVGKMAMT